MGLLSSTMTCTKGSIEPSPPNALGTLILCSTVLKPEMARRLSRKICGWNARELENGTAPPQQAQDKCSLVTLCKADSFCPVFDCFDVAAQRSSSVSRKQANVQLMTACSFHKILLTLC